MSMLCLLLSLCSCDTREPVPLPPTVQQHQKKKQVNGHFVKVGRLQGYLARPVEFGNHEAIIMRIQKNTPTPQAMADQYPDATVFIIDTTQHVPTAQKYLEGLDGVNAVSIKCSTVDCPALLP
jgi:hypothetical protein